MRFQTDSGRDRYRRTKARSVAVRAVLDERLPRFRFPLAVACFLVLAGLGARQAEARPPVPPDVFRAVRAYWHTKPERVEAFNIVACETGNRYNTTARNGQYLGLFQFGSFARARYGFGWDAWSQARAAHAYYLDAGWSPWTCA